MHIKKLIFSHILEKSPIIAIVCFPSLAFALGGTESMDRPSMRPLPEPPAAVEKPRPNFQLPIVPENDIELTGGHRQLHISRIEFIGNTLLDEQVLHELAQSYENKIVTVSELETLRQRITQIYVDNGYINSGAILTEDALNDGVLSFTILEGHLEEIVVHGQEWLREGYISNRLLGNAEQPLNLQQLQDRFQMLLSDPLISQMNGRILPGSSPGKSILDVDVTRAQPYQLSLLGNNQRPPSIGAEAFGVNGWVRNLTGLGDMVDFTYYNSAGSNRYTGGLSLPITDQDTQVFFHFDEGDSSVQEQPIRKINVTSQVHSLEGGISHPFINTSRQKLNFGTLLAIRENQTYLDGKPFSFVTGDATGHTQATVVRTFQDYIQRWDNHALSLRSTFSLGINALGATIGKNNKAQDSEFFTWLGQAQYAYRVDEDGSQVVLRGNSQLSNDVLLPLERISIGGMGTVRGYRENQLVRDEGYNLSVEYRYPVLGGSTSVMDSLMHLNLVPFIDYGSAWNKGEKQDDLLSAGAGFDFDWKQLHTEFYYGYAIYQPTQKQQSDLQDMGIHFKARLDVF